jgi:phosphonate transport system substrate-binding protein
MKTLLIALATTTALAGAASAEGIKAFNIGILGGENAQDRMTNTECFRAKVEAELGVPTKIFTPADYDGVIQGLLGGTLDYAWLGASAYAKTYLTNPEAVDVVLTKQNVDGTTGYYSIGFARADSGITSMEDAKGKTFAFADPNSTSGYLVPGAELLEGYGKLEDYFAEVKMSGGHEQSIVGVANGDFDAAVAWADGLGAWEDGFTSGAFRKAADSGVVDLTTMKEIWRSALIPEGPMVVRRALPQDVKDKMYAMLDTMWETDPECAYAVAAGEAQDFAFLVDRDAVDIVDQRVGKRRGGKSKARAGSKKKKRRTSNRAQGYEVLRHNDGKRKRSKPSNK